MKRDLHHLHRSPEQPAASAVTYSDIFGVTRIGEVEPPNRLRVMLNLAGTRIYIEQAPADRSGIDPIAFATPDLDAALTEIAGDNYQPQFQPALSTPEPVQVNACALPRGKGRARDQSWLIMLTLA